MIDKMKQLLGMLIRRKDDFSIVAELHHGEVILGRSKQCTVSIEDPTVSALHARIYTYLSVSYIEDLDSSNGTFVNDKAVKKRILLPGDIIRLGNYQLIVDKRSSHTIEKANNS